MQYFTYGCGCKFPIIKTDNLTKIDFEPRIENLDLSCHRTWELISEGNTKGVFQLESRLGKTTARKLKPEILNNYLLLLLFLDPDGWRL